VTDAATLEEPNTVIIQQNYEVFLAVIVKRGVLGHYVVCKGKLYVAVINKDCMHFELAVTI
jgi:hypothetical protein